MVAPAGGLLGTVLVLAAVAQGPATQPLSLGAPETKLKSYEQVIEGRGLPDTQPFAPGPSRVSLPPTFTVAIAGSTARERDSVDIEAAVAPFIDLAERDYGIRGQAAILRSYEDLRDGLRGMKAQMAVAHVLEYLRLREELKSDPEHPLIPLGFAVPAIDPLAARKQATQPGDLMRDATVVLLVRRNDPAKGVADLWGRRWSVAEGARLPGALLVGELAQASPAATSQPAGPLALVIRKYSKDAFYDLVKGKADVCLVDQRVYLGLVGYQNQGQHVRVLATSPAYNYDVVFTTLGNYKAHEYEIGRTREQLTHLGDTPEGQEVLFFFDTDHWELYRDGSFQVARAAYPLLADLRAGRAGNALIAALLDPRTPVDDSTYTAEGAK